MLDFVVVEPLPHGRVYIASDECNKDSENPNHEGLAPVQ